MCVRIDRTASYRRTDTLEHGIWSLEAITQYLIVTLAQASDFFSIRPQLVVVPTF